jgi:hypothetical protein
MEKLSSDTQKANAVLPEGHEIFELALSPELSPFEQAVAEAFAAGKLKPGELSDFFYSHHRGNVSHREQ